MPETKIEFFERAATYVLSLLYAEFPEKTLIDPPGVADAIVGATDADVSLGSNSFDPAITLSATISYLIDEGFVRGDEQPLLDGWSVFSVCRLSERGLKLLAAVPATVDPAVDRRRPGERLADAVEQGAWKIGAQLLRELFGLRLPA